MGLAGTLGIWRGDGGFVASWLGSDEGGAGDGREGDFNDSEYVFSVFSDRPIARKAKK